MKVPISIIKPIGKMFTESNLYQGISKTKEYQEGTNYEQVRSL